MNKLFLGIISLLLYFSASFSFAAGCLTDNGDGTLTDPNNGLIWQNCAVGQTWDGKSCIGEPIQVPWEDAVLAAEGDRFQSKNNWILPTHAQNLSLLKSNCKRWTRGGFWSSSMDGEDDAKSIDLYRGTEHTYLRRQRFLARFVRSSQPSDIATFNASLDVVGKSSAAIQDTRNKERIERDAYDAAHNVNTVAAYTEFLNNYPLGKNGKKARDQLESLTYESAKRINTVAAFTDFLNKFPPGLNATRAKAEIDILLYEPVKRANNVAGYIFYLKKNPYGDHAPDAKEQINIILNPLISKAEAAFKCEEARQLDKQTEEVGISRLSNFDSCADKRKFNNVLILKNPQQQYLEAVKYENTNERSRAKRVYLTIMDNFSTSPVAMKAADRIASLKDVEAVESASSASRAAAERAADASRNAAYSVNRQNSEQCQNNRNACFSGCGIYKDYSQRNSCQSGCPLCAN